MASSFCINRLAMSLNWRISTSDDNTTPAYSFAPGFVERPANKVFMVSLHGSWTRSCHRAAHIVLKLNGNRNRCQCAPFEYGDGVVWRPCEARTTQGL